jgi:hypothetical protein
MRHVESIKFAIVKNPLEVLLFIATLRGKYCIGILTFQIKISFDPPLFWLDSTFKCTNVYELIQLL